MKREKTVKHVRNEGLGGSRGARQDWLRELMVGLVMVMFCPLVSILLGGMNVGS